jgi:hypothetical protein
MEEYFVTCVNGIFLQKFNLAHLLMLTYSRSPNSNPQVVTTIRPKASSTNDNEVMSTWTRVERC